MNEKKEKQQQQAYLTAEQMKKNMNTQRQIEREREKKRNHQIYDAHTVIEDFACQLINPQITYTSFKSRVHLFERKKMSTNKVNTTMKTIETSLVKEKQTHKILQRREIEQTETQRSYKIHSVY